ncbi:hypothetical protein A6U86_34045 [Rhizobium sp. AC27/96]|uniref:HlyD family secretion protein n=1 Tax=Rhizobium TaxID=379 RepID=UPI0008277A7B|nr:MULTISPECIES: HlyD family efflux transporter periplasmic adaptor subunit [Rhizobium]NTF46655.1 HlyD family efflux transporter periplasmic adaptor subunit [Rhizobium rhizogenes]OCI96587.1 hypothetical protein A6U86_34045 [Rhizobium sp. AC27/96]
MWLDTTERLRRSASHDDGQTSAVAGISISPEIGRDTLFRREAVDARRDQWFGPTQLAVSLSLKIVAPIAICLAVATMILLFSGSYSRRTTVSGVLLPTEGVTKIRAPIRGRIAERMISESQSVHQGDLLFVLDVDNVSGLGETQAAVTAELRQQRSELAAERDRQSDLNDLQKVSLAEQEDFAGRELTQIEKQIDVSEKNAEALGLSFERYKGYLARQIVIETQVDAKKQDYIAAQQQLEALKREQIQLEGKRQDLRSQLNAIAIRKASTLGDLARQIAQIDLSIAEGEAKHEIRLTAPRDGVVTGVVANAGEIIEVGSPMATILPAAPHFQVQLGAPSSAIGFLQVGQPVTLRYEAFPYQKFGQYSGRVTAISRTALRLEELTDLGTAGLGRENAASQSGENMYRITVQPDQMTVHAYGKAQVLTSGMVVHATIFLDRRPLYEWILDPIYSLKGAVSSTQKVPS